MTSWHALHVLQLQSLLLMLHAGNLRVTRLYLTPRLVALVSDRLHLQVHRMQAVPSFDQLRRQVLQRRGRCLWGMARQLELGEQGLGVADVKGTRRGSHYRAAVYPRSRAGQIWRDAPAWRQAGQTPGCWVKFSVLEGHPKMTLK